MFSEKDSCNIDVLREEAAVVRRRGRPVKVKLETDDLSCQYCYKVFKKRRNVVRHERIHTGEKPYACSDCDRRFSDESTLRQHIRTHSAEMNFLCNDCGKFFKSRNGLKYHRCSNMAARRDDDVSGSDVQRVQNSQCPGEQTGTQHLVLTLSLVHSIGY